MRVRLLRSALDDLVAARNFYETQAKGVGSYFFESIFSDIDSLQSMGGVHRIVFGFHRLLARRFPFAIYYRVSGTDVVVFRVLDCRRNPAWIRSALK